MHCDAQGCQLSQPQMRDTFFQVRTRTCSLKKIATATEGPHMEHSTDCRTNTGKLKDRNEGWQAGKVSSQADRETQGDTDILLSRLCSDPVLRVR